MVRRTTLYKRHRFPPEIILHAVRTYCRFNLSHRDIEDLLARHHRGPRKIATDKPGSYTVARRELMPDSIRDTSRYANYRAELRTLREEVFAS